MEHLDVFGYLGPGLMAPAFLSIIYGITAHRAVGILGYQHKDSVGVRFWLALSFLLLFVSWSMTNFSLPILYILSFLVKMIFLHYQKGYQTRELFLINLTHLLSMSLHMILIGLFSLFTATPMNEILENPLCRIITISLVLAADSLMAVLIPRWDRLVRVLKNQLDSEEVLPFVGFLGFCNMFLLLDSVLCISEINWNLLPLFLVTSTLLTGFFLIRFLLHLFTVLTANYLEKENKRLVEELTQQKRADQELRSKSELDFLTRVYSRWYAMDQIETLLKEHTPFSLVYIDLDHLKMINDRDGHIAGDVYLRHFAEALGTFLRESDIFARIGGDEFLILLPECSKETAYTRMEHIRSRLCGDYMPPLPFSFGVVFVSGGSGQSVEQVVRLADQAMYRDKNERR